MSPIHASATPHISSEKDGYLARYDRRISTAISRRLANTPVTPNQITSASLALGLSGAALLTDVRYPLELAGAVLLWASAVLDGCDGEVARMKRQSSEAGAAYDLAADHLCHAAAFAALILHVRRVHPRTPWALPAAALIAGVAASMVSVWRLILRRPEDQRGKLQRIFERIASRDYVYLIALLTALRHLDWFLWGAAVGSHLFWLGLWWVSKHPPLRSSRSPDGGGGKDLLGRSLSRTTREGVA